MKKRKKRILGFISTILAVALVLGLVSVSKANIQDDDIWVLGLGYILGALLGLWAFVIIHEFGHFVFGKLTGFRLVLFNVLAVAVYRNKNNKLRLRFYPSPFGGQCVMAPPKKSKNHKNPMYLYNLGGLIFSYTTTPLLIWPLLVVENNLLIGIIIGSLFISVYLLFVNSWPGKKMINDVNNTILLKRIPALKFAIYYQMEVFGNILKGLPYSHPTEYEMPLIDEANHITFTTYVFSYCAKVEMNDTEGRIFYYNCIRQSLYTINFLTQRIAGLMICCFEAFCFEKDDAKALRYYNRLNETEKKYISRPKNNYYQYYILAEEIINKKLATWDKKRLLPVEKSVFEGERMLHNIMLEELDKAVLEYIANDYQFIIDEGETEDESISTQQESSPNA